MWAGRDYDLYIERTAWIVPTILGVVDGVSSTLIHLTTGPDGYEALVWRRGNRAGPRRMIFARAWWSGVVSTGRPPGLCTLSTHPYRGPGAAGPVTGGSRGFWGGPADPIPL